jgi:hypothetical protein
MPEHIRLKWKGLNPIDKDGNPTPGFPGEHFAIVPMRDFTDDEYDNELDDEQRELIASRPDLYEDRGTAEDARKEREARAAEREREAQAARPASSSAHSTGVVHHNDTDKSGKADDSKK